MCNSQIFSFYVYFCLILTKQNIPFFKNSKPINLNNPAKRIIVEIQFLFVAFGASELAPLLIDIDPAVVLFICKI